ncbi:MAG: Uma2 family endonuclease [Waterburya sp.]
MITFDLDISLANSSLQDKDKTIVLADMTWDNYQELLEKNSNYRISYFAGIITIMSPSRNHERIAETISILINAYCRKHKINYFALGSSDIKNSPVSGKQPDTSYCFESEKEIPDIAVEVVFSSGGTADLKKYQVLKVKEVWFWENNKIQFYQLRDSDYVEIKTSNCLNQLSADFLTKFVNRGLIESNLIIETDFINEL